MNHIPGERDELFPPELDMPIGRAMFTQRAIRRMKPDPIPEHHLRLLFEAAGKAPSGGNNQRYRFLYATSRERVKAFGELYRDSWWQKRREMEGWDGPEDMSEGERRAYTPAMRLAEDIGDVPCVVFVLALPPHFPESVIPAAQNLMLAARALGIGSVPTRLHESQHSRFREIFAVPEEAQLLLCIPLGYPAGSFGPTTRLPTWETSYRDVYGQEVPWAPGALEEVQS